MFGIPYSGIHWLYHMPIKFCGLIFRVFIGKKIRGVRINFHGHGSVVGTIVFKYRLGINFCGT